MSGRSWKFESSHGHEKQKSANSRFFFALPSPFSCFCFPHTTTGCPSLSSKKHDNKDNISVSKKCCSRLSLVVVKKSRQHRQQRQHFFLIPKSVVQGCPSLSSKKKSRQHRQQRQHFFLIPKSVVQVCPSLSSKKITTTQTTKTTFLSYSKSVVQGCPSLSSKSHDNIDNKDNISISKKCCPRLSKVVVKKITTTQTTKTTFLSYSKKCCPRLSLVVVNKSQQH